MFKEVNVLLFVYSLIFGGDKSILSGHWYPFFRLLVTSSLGFRARVGNLIRTRQRSMCYKILGGHMPFCGATDSPVLDFLGRLLLVSKPEWAVLFSLGRGIRDIRSQRFTSSSTPVDLFGGQHDSWTVLFHVLAIRHWWGSEPFFSVFDIKQRFKIPVLTHYALQLD